MELVSQECCLHRVLFTCCYVTFVLVIITFAFTLYNDNDNEISLFGHKFIQHY